MTPPEPTPEWRDWATHCTETLDPYNMTQIWNAEAVWRRAFELLATETELHKWAQHAFAQAWREVHK